MCAPAEVSGSYSVFGNQQGETSRLSFLFSEAILISKVMLWTLCCLQGDLHLYVVFFFWCFFSHPYHRIEHHVEHHEISFKKNGVELNSFITELSNFTVNNTLRRLFPVIQDQSPTNFCPVFNQTRNRSSNSPLRLRRTFPYYLHSYLGNAFIQSALQLN